VTTQERRQLTAEKIAAARFGMALQKYLSFTGNGFKRCWRCKVWHPKEDFGVDRSRADGLSSSCRASKREQQWLSYKVKIARQRFSRDRCCCCHHSIDHRPPLICWDCVSQLQEAQKEAQRKLGTGRTNHAKKLSSCSRSHPGKTSQTASHLPSTE